MTTNRGTDLNWTIPRPGEIIADKYVIEGFCGRGGLAIVLSAMHAGLDQRVAIKMLLPEWAGDAEVVERFLREGRAATRIKSEHVVRVFDVGTLDNGAPYLVLEYLEGHNLDDVVAMWGPAPVPAAIDWVLQAAEAIAEAHAYGIVHRDLKPANLFLTHRADGSVCIKVLDFGLSKLTDPHMRGAGAKLTRPNDVMGSPHYMAPEQLRATRDADARTDLWALGAVLHELLSGHPPFRGDSVPEICATVLTQPPPPLSTIRANIPIAVEEAVLRCLEKDPAARFATAAELARAIAPFGTTLARESCARIERVLEGRASDVPTPEPSITPLPDLPAAPDWPSDMYVRARTAGTSARVVLGAFLMLAGLGFGVLLVMYHWVHAGEPAVGVTAPQGNGQPTPAETPMATPTATPTATSTSVWSVSSSASSTSRSTSGSSSDGTSSSTSHSVSTSRTSSMSGTTWSISSSSSSTRTTSSPPSTAPSRAAPPLPRHSARPSPPRQDGEHGASPAPSSDPTPSPAPASTAPSSDGLFDGRK
jgi:serine/threonine-protein kinase